MGGIFKAHHPGYLEDIQIGGIQQAFGLFQAKGTDEMRGRDTGQFFHFPEKMGAADPDFPAQLGQGKVFIPEFFFHDPDYFSEQGSVFGEWLVQA